MSTLQQERHRSGPNGVARRTIALVHATPGEPGEGEPDDPDLLARLTATLLDFGEPHVDGLDRELPAVRSLLAELHQLLTLTDRDAAARAIDGLLATFASPPRLERHDGWDWHLHLDGGLDATWERWIGANAASALGVLLCAGHDLPWGVCASDGCRTIYLHDGRGAPRRFCSARCGTRERVRRHRSGA